MASTTANYASTESQEEKIAISAGSGDSSNSPALPPSPPKALPTQQPEDQTDAVAFQQSNGQKDADSGGGTLRRMVPPSTQLPGNSPGSSSLNPATAATSKTASAMAPASTMSTAAGEATSVGETAAAAATVTSVAQQEQRVASPALAPPPNKRRLRIYPTGRNRNSSKWVTREIAALDFLSGLRMRNEDAILTHGKGRGGAGDGVGVGVGVGGGGSHAATAGSAVAPSMPRAGSAWGWELRKGGGGSGGSGGSGVDAAGRVAADSPASGGRGGGVSKSRRVGGEANSKDVGGRNSASRAGAGAGAFGVAKKKGDDDSDDDSEGGWLDQPLPSAHRGGGGVESRLGAGDSADGSGNASAEQLGGTPTGSRVSGAGLGGAAPARRLRGREAAHVRLPATFRHSMHNLPGHSAADVRQWEQGLTRQDRLLEGRMFFSSSKGYPMMVSSVIHYKPQEEETKRARQKRIDERGAEAFEIPKRDWRGFSYAHLLLISSCNSHGDNDGVGSSNSGLATSSAIGGGTGGGGGAEKGDGSKDGAALPGGGGSVGSGEVGGDGRGGDRGGAGGDKTPYKAGFLDDPALKVGRHRHMTRGDQHTGPVVSSVLLFVKPRVLKDELNARFREEHPSLPPSLTLSKIRSVKRQALLGCYRANMEVSTVALACIYFERLCLAGLVTKPNRRLTMAACLAIAYKFNESSLEGVSKLPALWAFVDQEWQVSKKRVLEAEFGVLVRLSFDLLEDPRDIFHHFVLLLKMVESNAELYLGEEMMGLHQASLETFFYRRDRNGSTDDGNAANGGGGGDSPGCAGGRSVSDSGAIGADGRGRARAEGPQRSPFLETPAWLQRNGPTSGSRWLPGWRAGGAQPARRRGTAPEAAAGPRAGAAERGLVSAATARLARLQEAARTETRQRGQRLGKNLRSRASSLVAGRQGLSTAYARRRRRSRRLMETEA